MRKLTALALTHKPDETPVAVADQNCLSSARYARPDASGAVVLIGVGLSAPRKQLSARPRASRTAATILVGRSSGTGMRTIPSRTITRIAKLFADSLMTSELVMLIH